VDDLRRSPGFASKDARFCDESKNPVLSAAFPEFPPVAHCDFLAYSCAAARELHPLPCLRFKAKTRKPKDISKSKKTQESNVTGSLGLSQIRRAVAIKD
jgi:hypothetical protein